MKKTIIIFIIVAALIGGGAFYGGMVYGKSQSGSTRNFANGARQGLGVNGAGGFARNGTGATGNGNVVSGQVIAKDDKSITVQLPNGSGSKIVFLSPSTQIMKTATGSTSDLQIGENLSVNGQANSDGSVTAQTIQIRPNLPRRATSTPAN